VKLRNPHLVLDAPRPYFGMRDRTRPPREAYRFVRGVPVSVPLQPKYTFPQIRQAIGRSAVTWNMWETWQTRADQARTSSMPTYLSAYMALLDDAHPDFVAVWDGKNEGKWPSIKPATIEEVYAWRVKHGLGGLDGEQLISEAFDYDGAHINRQHSIPKIGNDGVRWNLLRLLMDDHPEIWLEHAAKENDGVQPDEKQGGQAASADAASPASPVS
jgi:hypothetical protein